MAKHPFAHPDYPDFPSKNQALKASVPWARFAAKRDAARPDLRAEIVGLIEAALVMLDGGDRKAEAEYLLERYDQSR